MLDSGFRMDRLDKRPVWRKITDALWEEFKHAIGYPESLSRAIRTGLLSS